MGGGERLCCETMRALLNRGHELTLLSGDFQPDSLEKFFGFRDLFQSVSVKTYPADSSATFATYRHLLHHEKAQKRIIKSHHDYDLVFSTQDAGYIPEISVPVLQWGYFPNKLEKGMYGWPLRAHYSWKVRRIGLVLAISKYSKSHFDATWNIPTALVYPACNMIRPKPSKDNIVVTAARGVPEKNLELFWDIARKCPQYEFVMLLTVDPRFGEYSKTIQNGAPENGEVLVNPDKESYQELLSRSRIYLHLMRGEHFGITIVESMSAGCVPVVHASGGPKEIVGNTGFLWHEASEIPSLLAEASHSFDRLSSLCTQRAKTFSGEEFDRSFGEVLEGIVSRVP